VVVMGGKATCRVRMLFRALEWVSARIIQRDMILIIRLMTLGDDDDDDTYGAMSDWRWDGGSYEDESGLCFGFSEAFPEVSDLIVYTHIHIHDCLSNAECTLSWVRICMHYTIRVP